MIPIPEDFQFKWDSPEEAAQYWVADLMHWPRGISPLSATMDVPAFFRGFNQAAQELSLPIRSASCKVINNYLYMAQDPWSLDKDEMERRVNEMRGKMGAHASGLLDRWYKEYEPEVRRLNDETLHADYSKLGDRELSELLERIVDKREREGLLHFLAVFPATGAVTFYEEVWTSLFGEPQGAEHLQLLQGFPNKSTEVGDSLWHLSLEARRRPAVISALEKMPASQAHEEIVSVEGGPSLRDAVDEWTAVYGWRASEFDVAEVTWREDPTPVYSLIREYATRDDYDPESDFKSLVSARQTRERAILEKLSGGPVEMFRQTLALAQQYLPVQEDHNFWIDQQGTSVQRVPTLEAGRRLVAANRIDELDDMFMLHYDELQDALRGGPGDLMPIVVRRRQDRARFLKITPPPELGTPLPPESLDMRPTSKFFGAPPETNPDPRILNGNGASAGTVTGIARVIPRLEESDRLKVGEILVCPATMPPWTPLFALAAAVVTDQGGVLSHTAIVAREYQIPAVVGTKLGTALIQDGQTITVDGTAGTVTLGSGAEPPA
jgi:pyruvate,water dikinase